MSKERVRNYDLNVLKTVFFYDPFGTVSVPAGGPLPSCLRERNGRRDARVKRHRRPTTDDDDDDHTEKKEREKYTAKIILSAIVSLTAINDKNKIIIIKYK